MSIRKVCVRKGHRFGSYIPGGGFYEFCLRWRCDASAVSVRTPLPVHPETAVAMHNAIPRDRRFPPVDLAYVDGEAVVVASWPEGKPPEDSP